jgi:hypothetical protein
VVSGEAAGWFAIVASVLLIPFTQALVSLPTDSELPPVVTLAPFHPPALLLLAGLWLLNALLLHPYLARCTPQEGRLRPWVRWLRFGVAGLPLLGSLVVVVWRLILDRQPKWAFEDTPRPRPLALGGFLRMGFLEPIRHWVDRLSRGWTTDLGLGLLALGNTVVVGIALWSRISPAPEADQRMVLAVLAAGFHLLAFAAMAWSLYVEARQAEITGPAVAPHLLLAFCWLVPLPYLALFGLLGIWIRWWFFGNTSLQEQTLVHRAHAATGRLLPSLGRSLNETIRQAWRGAGWLERLRQPTRTLSAPVEPLHAEDRLLWLYRGKTLALAFDAAALAWIALSVATRNPGWLPRLERALDLGVLVGAILCVLALLGMAAYFVGLALRSLGPLAALDRHPLVQFLALSQFAWIAGLEAGRNLFHQDSEALAQTLMGVGMLGCVTIFVGFLLRIFLPGGERIQRPNDGLLGLVGFLAVGLLGQGVRQGDLDPSGLLRWAGFFVFTGPLWHLLIGWRLSGWFRRGLDLPGSTATSPTDRVAHAALWLPLGGLAVPWWIYRRHRRSPRAGFK